MTYLTWMGIAYVEHKDHIDVQLPHALTMSDNMLWVEMKYPDLYYLVNEFRWKQGYIKRLQEIENAGIDL